MSEEHPEKQSADQPNESGGDRQLKRLTVDLRAASRQVAVQTEGLGMIYTRRPTWKMSLEVCRRLSDPEQDDSAVARIFMGCVSGTPREPGETISTSLDEEQVAKLSDGDVRRLAEVYLSEIEEPPMPAAEPIYEIAKHARAKLKEYNESNKKLATTVGASLRSAYDSVYGTAELMRKWNDQFSAMGRVGDVIRKQHKLAEAIEGIRIPSLGGATVLPVAPMPKSPSLEAPRFKLPSPEETVPGRTMLAAEKSQESVVRMEEAMGLIVEQAGNVSTLVAKVIEKIEEQSREFQERSETQTKNALGYARWSLAIAATALLVSAVFSGLTYLEARSDATASSKDTAALIQQEKLQSQELKTLIAQARHPSPPLVAPKANLLRKSSQALSQESKSANSETGHH